MVSSRGTLSTIGVRAGGVVVKPDLELTSVPAWSVAPTCPDVDESGRFWTMVGIGPGADAVLDRWTARLASSRPAAQPLVHRVATEGEARDAVATDLAEALVGWRLMVAGPAQACLRLRAYVFGLGVGDDEMTIASTEVARRDVYCVHCRTVTTAAVALEDELPCAGCGRTLLVYYHVSRRQGAHLGFMVDAEQPRNQQGNRSRDLAS